MSGEDTQREDLPNKTDYAKLSLHGSTKFIAHLDCALSEFGGVQCFREVLH
jgi:hypothetical protein